MRDIITDFDLTKLTPCQREVLTVLARRLSTNELERLLYVAEATTRIDSDALLRAVRAARVGIGERHSYALAKT